MPSINSKNLLKFLKKKGFYIHHQVGSHIVLKHDKDTVKRVTLPMHNKDIKPGTLSSILKQYGIIRASIFGSAASDTMKKDSDIDILVELPHSIHGFDYVALKVDLQ